MIIDEILEAAGKKLQARTVTDVVIGLGYTAVRLDDGSCGLAATLLDDVIGCCSYMEQAGDLAGSRAPALAEMALSTDILQATIGLATINAVVNQGIKSNVTSSPAEALHIGKDDVVGMVGYFHPLVGPIAKMCKQLYVLERNPAGREMVYPDWAAGTLLPQCNVVIISGTTLINKTIDHLLELSRCPVGIMGPTTTMSPVLKQHGVTFVFGSIVRDGERVLKIVSQGGGTPAFGKSIEKINFKL